MTPGSRQDTQPGARRCRHAKAGAEPHACTPLQPSSRLKVLSIISAALALAKRYKLVDSNVAEDATMPGAGRPQPNPPTPEQAARLLNIVCTED